MSPSMKNSKIKYSMKLVLLKSVSPHVDRRYFQDPENQAAEGRLRPSPDHGPDLLFKLQSGPLSTRGRGAVRSVVGWENVSMRSRSTSGPTGSHNVPSCTRSRRRGDAGLSCICLPCLIQTAIWVLNVTFLSGIIYQEPRMKRLLQLQAATQRVCYVFFNTELKPLSEVCCAHTRDLTDTLLDAQSECPVGPLTGNGFNETFVFLV